MVEYKPQLMKEYKPQWEQVSPLAEMVDNMRADLVEHLRMNDVPFDQGIYMNRIVVDDKVRILSPIGIGRIIRLLTLGRYGTIIIVDTPTIQASDGKVFAPEGAFDY